MTKLSHIKQRLLSSQGQKISLTFLIVGVFFFASTFAQGSPETNTQTSKLLINAQYVIWELTKLFSRSWILLATLAGKFMTNDMVYGSWLHLDVYLWKLRNICKNFANFALLGILLREIIQYVTKKTGSIQSIVTKSVIAGILIQASWFIMAALLDISTIATAAIGSFPSHFIDSNAFSKWTMSNEIDLNINAYKLIFDKNMSPTLEETNEKDKTTTTVDELIQKIMPKNDSVAGPLIYIWASTLKIQNALIRPKNQDINVEKVFTTSVLQFLAIGIYCITLILLLITNIIRVGLLWVIIPLSPILVLMFTLWKSMGKEGIAKNFDIGVILNAIFKPAIFTWVLSLVLIFIVSMQNIMTSGNDQSFTIQWTTFGSSGSLATMEVKDLFKTSINDTVFTQAGNMGKNIFSNIIIYFATIFLLRYLVKIAATSGGWTIWETMTKATWLVENMASTTPILWWYSVKAYMEGSNKAMVNMWRAAGVDLNYWSSNFGKMENEEYRKWLSTKLGEEQRRSGDISALETASNFSSFMNKTNSILKDAPLSYKDSQETFEKRETLFNKILVKEEWNVFMEKKKNYFDDPTKLTLQWLNKEWFKKLHELLGGTDGSIPKNYDEFKKIKYGKVG